MNPIVTMRRTKVLVAGAAAGAVLTGWSWYEFEAFARTLEALSGDVLGRVLSGRSLGPDPDPYAAYRMGAQGAGVGLVTGLLVAGAAWSLWKDARGWIVGALAALASLIVSVGIAAIAGRLNEVSDLLEDSVLGYYPTIGAFLALTIVIGALLGGGSAWGVSLFTRLKRDATYGRFDLRSAKTLGRELAISFWQNARAAPIWIWLPALLILVLQVFLPQIRNSYHHYVERPALIDAARSRGAIIIGPGDSNAARAHGSGRYDLVIVEELGKSRTETYYDPEGNMSILRFENDARKSSQLETRPARYGQPLFAVLGILLAGGAMVPACFRTAGFAEGRSAHMRPTELTIVFTGVLMLLLSMLL